MIDVLWDGLVYEEPGSDSENDEDAEDYTPENFDPVKNEQIKQDLRLIEMLGMVSKLHLTSDQKDRVLQIASSKESTSEENYAGAVNRIKAEVVEWCRANPALRKFSFPSPFDSNLGSVAYIFE